MPHSRWNDLPVEALRAAGYTLLSWSAAGGADIFVRQRGSLLLFFQGHPEYEDTTLLKEYRRDVGRYLNGAQENYPTLPIGYLSAEATQQMEDFRAAALSDRRPERLERFPFAAVAAGSQKHLAALGGGHLPQLARLHCAGASGVTTRRTAIIGLTDERRFREAHARS